MNVLQGARASSKGEIDGAAGTPKGDRGAWVGRTRNLSISERGKARTGRGGVSDSKPSERETEKNRERVRR